MPYWILTDDKVTNASISNVYTVLLQDKQTSLVSNTV